MVAGDDDDAHVVVHYVDFVVDNDDVVDNDNEYDVISVDVGR